MSNKNSFVTIQPSQKTDGGKYIKLKNYKMDKY